LNWWPHQLYRLEIDEIFGHEEFALTNKGKKAHQGYAEKELIQMKEMEK